MTAWFLMAGCDLTRAPLQDDELIGTEWRVDKLWTPEETIVPGPDTTMIVNFLDDWGVGAGTPCNSYGGVYGMAGGWTISITFLTRTEMACFGRRGTLEGRFIAALETADRYTFDDDVLMLYDIWGSYKVKLSPLLAVVETDWQPQ